MTKISGRRLCGAVKYKSDAEPQMMAVCHCENRRRQTGASFSLIVAVPEDSVSFESDATPKEFHDKGEGGAVSPNFRSFRRRPESSQY